MTHSSEALPDVKNNNALRSYFEKVYPEIDLDRVYASDMKKIVSWFKVIQQNNIDFTVKSEEEDESTEENVATEAPAAATAGDTEEVAKPKRTRKKKSEE